MQRNELRPVLQQKFPRERTYLLPSLHFLQHEFGYLPGWALQIVSWHLRIPASEVYGAATSYRELRVQEPGKHIVRVCNGLSCWHNGGQRLLEHLTNRFGISPGETTPDGGLTLEETPCGFLCPMAPAVETDGNWKGRATPQDIIIGTNDEGRTTKSPSMNGPLPFSTSGRVISYSELQQATQQRLQEKTSGKTRVLVQVGHCSQAVGALEMAEALRNALADRSDAYLVIAGCDGACFAAPQVIVTLPSGAIKYYSRVAPQDVAGIIGSLSDDNNLLPGDELESFFAPQHLVIMSRCGQKSSTDIDEYIADGGYRGLDKALSQSPEQVINEALKSGLLGRGGAYFPPARKWQGARSVNAPSRYIVVNAEEGEPGLFKDRHLMEGDPHRLLEGALIAAYASGASQIYIYINAEANLSAERMETAIAQAQKLGLIGENILGSGFNCEAWVRRGAGGYVCGEETTLLNTIEGDRREPRLRPPFPTESGLFRQPTVINNVETLVNVPGILDRGAARFSQIGLDSARGTKLICLSGSVQRPGLAEVPMGATLRQIIYDIGGGPPPGRNIGVIAVGGPSSGVLPVSELDTPLRPGMLHPSGVVMGAGGVMVLDDSVPVIEVVQRLAAYNAAESCGKCAPCREGTPRMVEALDRLASGHGSPNDLDELRYLAEIVGAASLCGLGQMSGGPINSALHFFGKEMARLAGVG